MNSPRSLPDSSPLWMSLDELGHSADFQARLANEFPQGAAMWDEGLSRRRFLQLMGASLALAGMNGCMRLPEQKIVPYTDQPEKLIPGKPLHFATTLQINGHPRGVIVTQHEGRPTHIAGNPRHPLSLGATDVWTQAAVLDLYDPDRLQSVRFKNEISDWDAFATMAAQLQDDLKKTGGEGLALLTGSIHSPTELLLLQRMLAFYPKAKWYRHEPISDDDEEISLAKADVIFALDSDFLYDRPDSLALTRAFSRRRRSEDGSTWNRLYVAEACPTVTGTKADHRFVVPPQEFLPLARALLQAVQKDGSTDARWPWLGALAADLKQHAGRCLVLAGRSASEETKSLFFELNQALGNFGKTISAKAAILGPRPGSLADLCGEMEKGTVTTLFMVGGNPVYDAPANFAFRSLLAKVPLTIHHSFLANETSACCAWVTHAAHDLEAWGDAQSLDGTCSIRQPLIAPLYGGRSVIEVLSLFTGDPVLSGYDAVRQTWMKTTAETFETDWHRWLRSGVIDALASSPLASASLPAASAPAAQNASPPGEDLSATWLIFRPSSGVWDGRHANNGWLQELPDPITKLTWDNAALLSPAFAKTKDVKDGDMLKLKVGDAVLEMPSLIVPGHADQCVSVTLGYGHTMGGSVGTGVGFNAYLLRRSDALWHMPLDEISRTGRSHSLARTQEHFRMEGRDLLHVSRVDSAVTTAGPAAIAPPMPSLYPEFPYEGHKWAMSLDLNTCTGCNACIIACQSENNIPVVGKEQVLMGREMQWIRVDRYYQGSQENPRTHFQPVTCMQCEKAPCEVVCPVAATQHDDEGLNVMVYNRCVGTRYCSNNCPYKVRRFNFLFYNSDIPESQRLRLNPNVTVRSRGVMEKCTYCVQRIEEARIDARREHRALRGELIITACQAACPAEAIVFGDLNDPESPVAKNRGKPGHYAMLEELNTQPRTTYLEKRINLNPAIEPAGHPGLPL